MSKNKTIHVQGTEITVFQGEQADYISLTDIAKHKDASNTDVVCYLMTTPNDDTTLLNLLDKAEQLASEFQGGYSGQFLSAEEFHTALSENISKLKQGDRTQLDRLHLWFLPTSCWDDFVGKDGQDLANEISGLLSKLTKA